jgi:hypothetical protein
MDLNDLNDLNLNDLITKLKKEYSWKPLEEIIKRIEDPVSKLIVSKLLFKQQKEANTKVSSKKKDKIIFNRRVLKTLRKEHKTKRG